MHRRLIDRIVPLVALLSLLAAVGCSPSSDSPSAPLDWSEGPACPPAAGGEVTLAVGARANSSIPQIPVQVRELMEAAARAGSEIAVVRVDGAPSSAFSGTFHSEAGNDVARQNELDTFLGTVNSIVAGLTPRAPEADVLGALNEAARLTSAGGYVVLIDSGLQTTGLIRFQYKGMFDADPNEVVNFLSERGQLPDLQGRAVVFAGLGNTADPQPTLVGNADARRKLTRLWRTIAERAGASCVAVLETQEVRRSVDTDVTVTVVPVPDGGTFDPCGENVFRDDGSVGFLPDSTDFRDPAAARETLRPYAEWLRDHPAARAELIGYIAHYGSPTSSLSLRRAERVREVLIELGADADQINARGGGWGPVPHPSAPPDPSIDHVNRMVIISVACT